MGIQGDGSRVRFARRGSLPLCILLALSLGIPGCARVRHAPVWTDHSELPPEALLRKFLETERSKQAVKFVFKGEIEVEAGKRHKFRGYCGYVACDSLRMKLVGPLGFTVLDYLNSGGEAKVGVNHLTEEGDEEALRGLLTLMESFTRALVDRCRPAEQYVLEEQDPRSVTFSLATAEDPSWSWSLDRKLGVVVHQTTIGTSSPRLEFDYRDYDWFGDYWLPAEIGVRRADPDMEFAIHMAVRKWDMRADLPDAFFE